MGEPMYLCLFCIRIFNYEFSFEVLHITTLYWSEFDGMASPTVLLGKSFHDFGPVNEKARSPKADLWILTSITIVKWAY